MRKDWLNAIAASFAAVAITGGSVMANPALMAAGRPEAKQAAVPTHSELTTASQAARPGAQPSHSKNPFKDLTTSLPGFGTKKSSNVVMPSVNPHDDVLSLDKSIGAPTLEFYINAAQHCESLGKIDQARNNYQTALNKWPGHVEVLRNAARMEDRMGQLAVAENLYNRALATDPSHAGALNDLGLCLARQGKLDASVQVLERAIQLNPDKPLYRNNAATVLVELRQDQRALAHLATVHNSADANYNFGQLLVQRGREMDAAPYFQAAVDQNPQMQHAYVALAKLRGEQPQPANTYAPVEPQQNVQPTPTVAPEYAPQNGPTLNYPATAAGSRYNMSPQQTQTRYLPPPVAQQPQQTPTRR